MVTTRIYVQELRRHYPAAFTALKLTEEQLEASDLCFYVRGEHLFCESMDDGDAFRFDGKDWVDEEFPLQCKSDLI